MLVRTFEGSNLNEVMRNIREEFGSEAVILSKKEKKFEDTYEKIVEIKAAIPEKIKNTEVNSIPLSVSAKIEKIEGKIDRLDQNLTRLSKSVVSQKQSDQLQSMLRELNLLMHVSIKNESVYAKALPRSMINIYNQMLITGLDQAYIVEIINQLKNTALLESKNQTASEKEIKNEVIKLIAKNIKIAPKMEGFIGQTFIHAFVGPAGSGKTSALVKLAYQLNKKYGKDILICGSSDGKVGATETLKIYCKILNIPYYETSREDKLDKVIMNHRNKKFILIDTPGIDANLHGQVSSLNEWLSCGVPIETNLVLSLTEKSFQLDRTIQNFSHIGLHSLIFSKIDESWTYGDIYNLSYKWDLPLSFFSTGSLVPDDFERATRERVVERILSL